jgi:hypothetical protein
MGMQIKSAINAGPAHEAPIDGEEAFTSDRFALLMRVAKLVGTSAEFICIICELSATEVKLRILHPLPENRFALELPNGDFYFVEKMWERDSEAGFRFSAPIDFDAFISEASPYAKRQVRLRTNLPAILSTAEAACPIVIRDLSQEGARLESKVPLAPYQSLRIDAEPFAAPVFGKVQWKSKLEYGISFQRAFGLAELAQIAWSLHEPSNASAGRPRRFEVVRNTPHDRAGDRGCAAVR